MEEVARIVLALESPDVAEEVMHFLDRTGRARVVGTAGTRRSSPRPFGSSSRMRWLPPLPSSPRVGR